MFCGTGGSVDGTKLTFRNGQSVDSDGCVPNVGDFTCTDCVFDKCTAGDVPRRD